MKDTKIGSKGCKQGRVSPLGPKHRSRGIKASRGRKPRRKDGKRLKLGKWGTARDFICEERVVITVASLLRKEEAA